MSLINDALKRAGTGRAIPAPEGGGAVMQPAEETPRTGNPMMYGIAGAAALLVIAIGGWTLKSKTSTVVEAQPPDVTYAMASTLAEALPYSVEAEGPSAPVTLATETVTFRDAAPEEAAAEPAPIPAAEPAAQRMEPIQASAPEPAVEPAATTLPAVEPEPVSAPIQVAQTSAAVLSAGESPAPLIKAESAPPAPATFPDLKLQAIYYRLKNPSVMMNGKNVRVGETISGAKIMAIRRYGVDVQWRGTNKFIAME